MNLVIYGAQAIALGTYKAIKEIFPNLHMECFLVTEMGNNPSVLGGIPVRELAEFAAGMSGEEKENTEILIATPETVMGAIEESLLAAGFHNFVRMDSVRWAQLQELAFVKKGKFMPLAAYPVGVHKPNLQVYKAKFFKDKELSGSFAYPEYMIDLQVGAARTEVRVAELLDCVGDNISDRNANYSELTGLYWVWKNCMQKNILLEEDGVASTCIAEKSMEHYYGLAHYRRLFDLTEDDLLRLEDNDIDVVLPYPMPYEPDIEAHHKRYLSDAEWNAVLQAMEELQPEYAVAMHEILQQGYMYNYNIIIAKRDVLAEYCSWLFPILFRVEEINNPDGSKAPNRYIGYIGETLETLYFMYNRENLNIAHAGCRFLV